MRTLLAACAVHLVAHGALAAQTTWVVPPGASLLPVIANASPGDILQLSGTHPEFTLDKGLTILGPATIIGDGSQIDVQSALTIPVGQQAYLAQIDFALTPFGVPPFGPFLVSHQVTVAGDASFENCSFACSNVLENAIEVVSGGVLLSRCDVIAVHGTPLRISGGYCSIAQSSLRAQLLGPGAPAAQPAIQQDGGVAVLSNVTAVGGGGNTTGLHNVYPESALVVTAGEAYVCDSDLAGGQGVGLAFGQAAPITAAVPVQVARSVLSGAPSIGAIPVPSMVGMQTSGPPQLGQTFTATATLGTAPQLLVIVGTFLFGVNTPPLVVEPVLGGASGLLPVTTVFLPAGPQVTTQIPVPNILSLVGSGVWLQAIQVSGAGIRASSMAGGIIH